MPTRKNIDIEHKTNEVINELESEFWAGGGFDEIPCCCLRRGDPNGAMPSTPSSIGPAGKVPSWVEISGFPIEMLVAAEGEQVTASRVANGLAEVTRKSGA